VHIGIFLYHNVVLQLAFQLLVHHLFVVQAMGASITNAALEACSANSTTLNV